MSPAAQRGGGDVGHGGAVGEGGTRRGFAPWDGKLAWDRRFPPAADTVRATFIPRAS